MSTSDLSSNTLYYIRGKIVNSTQSSTLYTTSIQITTDAVPSSLTPLISYPFSSSTLPTIDTTKVDFTIASFGSAIDATNIASRFDAEILSGTTTYSTIGGKTALSIDSQYYAVGNTAGGVTAAELFDKDTGTNMWTNNINLHTQNHSFSIWVYFSSYGGTNNLGFESPIVSLSSNRNFEYLCIDSDGRLFLWYHSGGSPGYRIYKMNTQLSTNTWYNVVFTFEPNSSDTTKWRVRGYVNGTTYGSYHTVGSAISTGGDGQHLIAFDNNADIVKPSTDSSTTANLIIGSRYPTFDGLPHTVSIKDLNFYGSTMTQAEITSLYNSG